MFISLHQYLLKFFSFQKNAHGHKIKQKVRNHKLHVVTYVYFALYTFVDTCRNMSSTKLMTNAHIARGIPWYTYKCTHTLNLLIYQSINQSDVHWSTPEDHKKCYNVKLKSTSKSCIELIAKSIKLYIIVKSNFKRVSVQKQWTSYG